MTNDETPPDDYRARQQAGLIVQRLATLDGVTIRESGHRSAVSLVADEIRELLQLIDEGTAQTVRAALNPAMRPPLSLADAEAIRTEAERLVERVKASGAAESQMRLEFIAQLSKIRRTEVDAEASNANRWSLERRRREDAAAMQQLHNRNAELQAELDEMHARLDDTDIATETPCGTCAGTHEAMVDDKYVDCPKCGPAPVECSRCLGDGKQHEHHMRGHCPETLVSTCDQCGGTGIEPVAPLIIEEGPLWIEQMMQEGRDNG